MFVVALALAVALVIVTLALRSQIGTLRSERDTLREQLNESGQRESALGGRIKRLTRQQPEEARRVRGDVLEKVVSIDDHVQQALAHASTAERMDGLREGLELLGRDLSKTLTGLGLERVAPAEGDAFDPALHDAIATEGALEGRPAAIHQVVSAGFRYDGRLLRPARVVVRPARADELAAEPTDEDSEHSAAAEADERVFDAAEAAADARERVPDSPTEAADADAVVSAARER